MVRVATLSMMVASVPSIAWATDYPNKPIRLIVSFGPGSSVDLTARLIAQPLQEELKQTVIVENKAGASGLIGTDYVASSAPDGYTIVIGTPSNMVLAPLTNAAARYDVSKFSGVGGVTSYYFVISTANKPNTPSTLQALTSTLRTGSGSYGATGDGTVVYLTGVRYMQAAGVTATPVHYQGSGAVLTDVAAGHVLFATETVAATLPLINGGMMRGLAVTSANRLDTLPNVPTVAEAGIPNFEVQSWSGLWAPKGTPQPVLDKLNAALNKVLASENIRERLRSMGLEPAPPLSATAFDSFVVKESQGWVDAYRNSQVSSK